MLKKPISDTEKKTYSGADSGCEGATEILGYQSKCVDCELPRCLLEPEGGKASYQRKQRNATIIKLRNEGKTSGAIAIELDLSERQVQRILKTAGQTA